MFGATAVLALAASIPDTAMVRVMRYFFNHDGDRGVYQQYLSVMRKLLWYIEMLHGNFSLHIQWTRGPWGLHLVKWTLELDVMSPMGGTNPIKPHGCGRRYEIIHRWDTPGEKKSSTIISLSLLSQASRYMREFEALPPQEVPIRLKDLADEWLGLTMGLFSGTTQVWMHS